MYTFFDQRRLV